MQTCNAFYAFPSKPDSLSETIHEAIKKINKNPAVKVYPWTEINPNGKIIISQILQKITKSELFIADISGMNANVFFELGFAIAKGKRIWLTIDNNNFNNLTEIKEFKILSGIGYKEYLNDDDIVSTFLKEKPFENLDENLLNEYKGIIDNIDNSHEVNEILYLKSIAEHTASKHLTKFLDSLHRRLITIDRQENSYQPLRNFLINILRSRICIVHLLSNNHNQAKINNAIFSFYAGMAVGFNRYTLLLVPEPYESPLDYKDFLFIHKTAKECVELTKSWIYPLLSKVEIIKKETSKNNDSELTLLKFVLGDGQAEHEVNDIDNFFVETSQFNIGIKTNNGIFIGRKGSGKTANLFKIRDHFQMEKTNLVITIKPMSFKLETFVKLIDNYFNEIDLQSEFTEKIWQFVIYTSIANEIYNILIEKPSYYELTKDEQKLVNFVNDKKDVITADFGEKINEVYEKTKKLASSEENPKKILQILFNEYLSELITINKAVVPLYNRLVILVDNLDKAWDFGRDVSLQCKIIFGLFGFQNTLVRDFNWRRGDARLLIFLREDIFNNIKVLAREPDKILLTTHRLLWDDYQLLFRVIEERFIACDKSLNRDSVWTELFCEKINSVPTKEYLSSVIIPRPRDLIYLTQQAINECINHRNLKISENDILSAQKIYFEFLLENTVTEYKLYFKNVKDLVLAFSRGSQIFSLGYLKKKIKPFINENWSNDQIINFLINISFLGIEIDNVREFAYSDTSSEKIFHCFHSEIKKYFTRKIKFIIHPAFYIGLS